MSRLVSIRETLEKALNSMSPALLTAWENMEFNPTVGAAYQAAYLMPTDPDNSTLGDAHYREYGIFHINLFYPVQTPGTVAATTRAELIRDTFYRGLSINSPSGDLSVRIYKTPAIGRGGVEGDRWVLPVRIYYFADIF